MLSLATDPTNPADQFAVRCYFKGRHIAYVERGKSELVTNFLKTRKPYRINILALNKHSISVQLVSEKQDTVAKEIGKQRMKLLAIRTDEQHFIIVTNQGERKVKLTWHGLPEIKAKCVELLGKTSKLPLGATMTSPSGSAILKKIQVLQPNKPLIMKLISRNFHWVSPLPIASRSRYTVRLARVKQRN